MLVSLLTASAASEFNKIVGYSAGVTASCENLGCSSYSGTDELRLEKCQALCDNTEDCNVVNYCPNTPHATCLGKYRPGSKRYRRRKGRCCMRRCSEAPTIENQQLISTNGGWDVYSKIEPDQGSLTMPNPTTPCSTEVPSVDFCSDADRELLNAADQLEFVDVILNCMEATPGDSWQVYDTIGQCVNHGIGLSESCSPCWADHAMCDRQLCGDVCEKSATFTVATCFECEVKEGCLTRLIDCAGWPQTDFSVPSPSSDSDENEVVNSELKILRAQLN